VPVALFGLPAVTASVVGDVGDGLCAETLKPHLADDLRIDGGGRDEPRRRGTSTAAVPAGRTRRLGAEEEVAHRAFAAGRAGKLGEDRQADRQPEAEHERERDGERREARARVQHGARRRQPPLIRGRSPHV
jgi:hypothetical protein